MSRLSTMNSSSADSKNYYYYDWYLLQCVPGEAVPTIQVDPYSVSAYEATLPDPIPDYEIALKITAYIVSFLMALIGNGSLIWIILTDKKLRTPTNALITNLAASDLMVACTCMWIHLGNSITTEWPFGSFICSANQFLQVTAVSSSTVTMAAIAMERFLVIIFPLRCTGKIKIKLVVAASWIIAFLNGAPHLYIRRMHELYWANRHEIWCLGDWPKVFTNEECETKEPLRAIYYTYLVVVMYFLPVVIIAVAYFAIMMKLLTKVSPGENAPTSKEKRINKQVTLKLIVLFCAFVICWTPRQVLFLFDSFRTRDTLLPDLVFDINFLATFLAYFNSAINPLLYAGMSRTFRKKYKRFFHKKTLND